MFVVIGGSKTLSESPQVGYLVGEMQPKSDAQLLRDYAQYQTEAAFTELVQRYTNLVYSAALRQVDSPDVAAEIAQNVFVGLVRNAKSLSPRLATEASLAGWLSRSARNLSLNHRRDEFRRLTRERHAMEQILAIPDAEPDWEELRRVLDDAMSELSETDYDALVLRFFQNQDFRAVGAAIGVSDDTAQKRVTRALDRLRELLQRRGMQTSAGALSIAIAANAVHAAPVGLVATISTAALTCTMTSTATFVATTTKTIAMTTLQKTLVAATMAVLAGAGIYEARHAAQLRSQVQALQQQQVPLAEQIRELQSSFIEATNQLASLATENTRLKATSREPELLKLRGEVARFRNNAEQTNDPTVKQALQRKANVERMKQLFAEHPEQQVPELALLSDDYFFDLARDQDLETTNGIRKAFSEIRTRAENLFAVKLQEALQQFSQTNRDQPPNAIVALTPYFSPPIEEVATLERYQVINTGKSVVGGWAGGWAISQKTTPDPDYDRQWFISPVGFSSAPFKQEERK